MENEEILEGSSKQLDLGRRLLKETEEIGAGVLSDLSKLTIKELRCNSLDKKTVYFFTFFYKGIGNGTLPRALFKYLCRPKNSASNFPVPSNLCTNGTRLWSQEILLCEKYSVADPGCLSWIADQKDSGSRILIRIKEFKYFNSVSKLSEI